MKEYLTETVGHKQSLSSKKKFADPCSSVLLDVRYIHRTMRNAECLKRKFALYAKSIRNKNTKYESL